MNRIPPHRTVRPFIRQAMRAATAAFLAGVALDVAAGQGPVDVRGNVGVEYVIAPTFKGDLDGVEFINPRQERENAAIKLQINADHDLSEHWSVGLRAFVREDMKNDDRDAARLDEAWVQYAAGNWDFRAGNQFVTWGSIESVSPLDVVNPRDYEEDIVEPIKIGIPAVRVRRRFSSSDLSAYWLPYYEPSRYVGPRSYYSLSGGLPNVYPRERWGSGEFALRYFQSGDGLDFGISYLSGRERNVAFDLDADGTRFTGYGYRSMRLGVEVTKVVGDLVLKSEVVARTSDEPGNRRALLYVAGVEYTASSIWRHSDLTLFAEYLGSSGNVRDIELFQNDLFAAVRWAINDQHSQRFQAGVFMDLDDRSGHVYRAEYSASPWPGLEAGVRYTRTRNYYPGPRHVEDNDGVFYLFSRYNF